MARRKNFGAPWGKEENDELENFFAKGMSISDIAKEIGRNTNGTVTQMERLGLIMTMWNHKLGMKAVYKLDFHSFLDSDNETVTFNENNEPDKF